MEFDGGEGDGLFGDQFEVAVLVGFVEVMEVEADVEVSFLLLYFPFAPDVAVHGVFPHFVVGVALCSHFFFSSFGVC